MLFNAQGRNDTISKIIRSFTGLLTLSLSLSILFLGMRAVMQVGGFCAEGGPYEIAVPCPEGIALLMPLSIFGLFLGGGLYFTAILKNGPKWGLLSWSALFISLGWNFLELAIYPPIGEELVIGWLICGILFVIMGGGPILLVNKDKALEILFGYKKSDSSFNAGLLLMNAVAVAGGIYLGLEVYRLFT